MWSNPSWCIVVGGGPGGGVVGHRVRVVASGGGDIGGVGGM